MFQRVQHAEGPFLAVQDACPDSQHHAAAACASSHARTRRVCRADEGREDQVEPDEHDEQDDEEDSLLAELEAHMCEGEDERLESATGHGPVLCLCAR